MNRKRKKIVMLWVIFMTTRLLFALNTAQAIQEYSLENGLKVFLLEDPQDARIHIEFTCRAGFSSQTQNTCGFFKLFTRMIKTANESLNFSDLQCNADSSKYFLDISPSQLQDSLIKLSDAVFSPSFSDEVLKAELEKLKKEVDDASESMGTYINAAIDSRVFSAAPWKHDSGIYPPLFNKTSEKKARTILKEISDLWYIPENSAIFISGNINSEKTLLTLKNSFGRFYSNFKVPVEKKSEPVNAQRRFVLHSPEISADLTQIVVQYTMLDMDQCDLMSIALGYENSLFKQLVLGCKELNIPGDEYINVAAAHKKDSSRLIIQTLMQPQKDKKKNISSLEQTELFLQRIDTIRDIVHPEEFEYAKKQSEYSMYRTASFPQKLMESLSSFWALQPYIPYTEIDSGEFNSQTAAYMMNRIKALNEKSLSESLNAMQAEKPFVFVIINSKDYKLNKKAYDKNGFEEINEKNASWYVQARFREMKESYLKDSDKNYYTLEQDADDNSYYQKNIDSFSTFNLSNSIPVISKSNTLSSRVSLIISIKGGKYSSADDNGFEEVMINLMAGLIQKKMAAAQAEGILTGEPYVTSNTDLSTGQVLIEFDAEDTIAALHTIANAIVFGEIAPADADRAVSGRKYRKRLENGTVANQMYKSLINRVFEKAPWQEIYDTEKEILLDTDYKKILSAYPALLNASRYTLIFCGKVPEKEKLQPLLEESFGLLAVNEAEIAAPVEQKIIKISSSKRDITCKVNHTFLTDIPAEKAGPQPAVLIPTTEFLDPVIYAFPAPEPASKQAALYNAVLCWLAGELTINDSEKAISRLPEKGINLGTITVMNVPHTREVDALYKTTIQNLENNLNKIQTSKALVNKIKDNWILTRMPETNTDSGTAQLIQRGLELSGTEEAATYYLEEYKWIVKAEAKDFLEILEYFPVRPPLRVYSADSKK